jgi:acetyltransferase-like isoleucine patch superfamily enzyme
MLDNRPKLKTFILLLLSSKKHPRPRLWVRIFVNPFVHRISFSSKIRRYRSRLDVFPWKKFEVGKNSLIEDFTVINNGAGDVIIGSNARVGIGSVIIGPVNLGDNVGLGQNVFVSGFNHGYGDISVDSNEQNLDIRPVTIDGDSHIGSNSVILPGVHIGKKVQVGAGSVVTKDIPDMCIVVGNPAKIVKRYNIVKSCWERI